MRISIAATMAVLALSACEPEEVELVLAPPHQMGPYAIGTTTLQVTDVRGKDLTIEVWYPALPNQGEPSTYPPTILTFSAVRDATPLKLSRTWPLVGFSHGNTAIRYQSAFLTEHLASHGFVVVAPDHNGNTLFDIDDDLARIMLERPDDVRYAIDAAIGAAAQPGLLSGLIRDGDWAVMGHSFGALTALVVGGGSPDYAAAIELCAEGGGTDRVCDNIAPEILDVIGDHGTVDDRVVATVAMSPFASYLFADGGDGLADVMRPLLLAGQLDDITPYEEEILPVYEHLGSPRRMLDFEQAGHYGFSDICLLAAAFFTDCDPDSGFADIGEVQHLTNQIVTAYLKVNLAGDDRYQPWIEAEAYADVPGVSLRID